jgi:hypothetical protein
MYNECVKRRSLKAILLTTLSLVLLAGSIIYYRYEITPFCPGHTICYEAGCGPLLPGDQCNPRTGAGEVCLGTDGATTESIQCGLDYHQIAGRNVSLTTVIATGLITLVVVIYDVRIFAHKDKPKSYPKNNAFV